MAKLSYISTKHKDIFYIVGFDILDDFFMLETDRKFLAFLDYREIDVFKEKNRNPNVEAVLVNPLLEKAREMEGSDRTDHKLALHIIETYGLRQEKIEVPTYFPLDVADFLRSKGVALAVNASFRPERLIKTKAERDIIEDAIRKTHRAYERIEGILHESKIQEGILHYRNSMLTSEILKTEADKVLFEQGLLSTEGMIISSGARAAMPHHPGLGPIRANETIVCDLFPVSRETGYFADMTRTYVKGKPSEKIREMYDAVLGAQELALSMIRPGVRAKDIHESVCTFFMSAGFDVGEKGFIHGTGHGLGLDLHEEPNINKMSEAVLEPEHVVTVEPGLYYPDLGGVRIEDVVWVTETGYENLTNYPKQLIIE